MTTLPLAFDLLRVGHCRQWERLALQGGRWAKIEFPALPSLLRHPTKGVLLFDTGYAGHFHAATACFPEIMYRVATPHTLPEEEKLLNQLAARGLGAADVGTIILSHFHADHVAGLRDFPGARLLATRAEYEEMRGKGRFARVHRAFLPALLPEDLEARMTWVESLPELATGLVEFPAGYDLLGDGSLLGINLPGHSRSQLGLLFHDHGGRRIFLLADAAWKIEGVLGDRLPSAVAGTLFASTADYRETFRKLVALQRRPDAPVLIPYHCTTSWAKFGGTRHV